MKEFLPFLRFFTPIIDFNLAEVRKLSAAPATQAISISRRFPFADGGVGGVAPVSPVTVDASVFELVHAPRRRLPPGLDGRARWFLSSGVLRSGSHDSLV